jgi:hypothetical protein
MNSSLIIFVCFKQKSEKEQTNLPSVAYSMKTKLITEFPVLITVLKRVEE